MLISKTGLYFDDFYSSQKRFRIVDDSKITFFEKDCQSQISGEWNLIKWNKVYLANIQRYFEHILIKTLIVIVFPLLIGLQRENSYSGKF